MSPNPPTTLPPAETPKITIAQRCPSSVGCIAPSVPCGDRQLNRVHTVVITRSRTDPDKPGVHRTAHHPGQEGRTMLAMPLLGAWRAINVKVGAATWSTTVECRRRCICDLVVDRRGYGAPNCFGQVGCFRRRADRDDLPVKVRKAHAALSRWRRAGSPPTLRHRGRSSRCQVLPERGADDLAAGGVVLDRPNTERVVKVRIEPDRDEARWG